MDDPATSGDVFNWVNERMLDASQRRLLIGGTLQFLRTKGRKRNCIPPNLVRLLSRPGRTLTRPMAGIDGARILARRSALVVCGVLQSKQDEDPGGTNSAGRTEPALFRITPGRGIGALRRCQPGGRTPHV